MSIVALDSKGYFTEPFIHHLEIDKSEECAPRLVLLALVLVASLAVGVFGLTLLFSQTVPSTTIRQPASGVISSNCPALTPAKTVFDPGTSGNFPSRITRPPRSR
jgi:hypothetical protein